jgi:hypothetical protein
MAFDPNAVKSEKALKARRKKAMTDVKNWSMLQVPEALREGRFFIFYIRNANA